MLVRGETFNERRQFILSMIKQARQFIKLAQTHAIDEPELQQSIISIQNQLIASYMQELIALKRWQAKRVQNAKKHQVAS